MSGFLNRVQLIGNLGRDPESHVTKEGNKVVRFDIATSERWVDDLSGERRDRTEWHPVAIFSKGLGDVAGEVPDKGRKVFVEGQLRTRKWMDRSGSERRTTRIELTPFNGTLTFLDSKRDEERTVRDDAAPQSFMNEANNIVDEIPF